MAFPVPDRHRFISRYRHLRRRTSGGHHPLGATVLGEELAIRLQRSYGGSHQHPLLGSSAGQPHLPLLLEFELISILRSMSVLLFQIGLSFPCTLVRCFSSYPIDLLAKPVSRHQLPRDSLHCLPDRPSLSLSAMDHHHWTRPRFIQCNRRRLLVLD